MGFLHTAAVHEVTFDRLLADMAPDATAQHVTRPDLLERARNGDAPRAGLADCLHALDGCDAVLCTCSTLGPLAEELGALRIDRPLADAAASYANPLIAYCLASTREPTLALMQEAGVQSPAMLLCPGWTHFERGEHELYAGSITRAVEQNIHDHDAIVLAQASMACAGDALARLGRPVLVAPPLAMQEMLRISSSK